MQDTTAALEIPNGPHFIISPFTHPSIAPKIMPWKIAFENAQKISMTWKNRKLYQSIPTTPLLVYKRSQKLHKQTRTINPFTCKRHSITRNGYQKKTRSHSDHRIDHGNQVYGNASQTRWEEPHVDPAGHILRVTLLMLHIKRSKNDLPLFAKNLRRMRNETILSCVHTVKQLDQSPNNRFPSNREQEDSLPSSYDNTKTNHRAVKIIIIKIYVILLLGWIIHTPWECVLKPGDWNCI